MASPFELKIDGLDKLQARIKKLSEAAKVEVVKEIQAGCENIAGGARRRVPRDTGFLAGSISNKNLDNGAESVAQKDYAAYVEFGTGAHVEIPIGLEEYARQFYVNGKGTLPASPFMFPSYFEEKPKLIERIVKKLDSQ